MLSEYFAVNTVVPIWMLMEGEAELLNLPFTTVDVHPLKEVANANQSVCTGTLYQAQRIIQATRILA